MNVLILLIASLTPFFASVMLLGLPNIDGGLLPLIEKYFYFLLVPALWQLTLAAAEFFMRSRPADNRSRTAISATLLIIMTTFSLLALQMVKVRFATEFLLLILVSVGLESIAVAMKKKGVAYAALLVLALSDMLMAQCSFLLVGAGSWQSLVFSAGLALQLCSYRLAAGMAGIKPRLIVYLPETSVSPTYVPPSALIQKLYLLGLISGIIFTSALSILGQLHPLYLLLYILLPLVIRLAEELRRHAADPRQITDFRIKNSGILLSVLVMIAALTQLL